MSSTYTPPNWPALIPRLAVADTAAAVEFLRSVFGAVGDYNENRPSELRIDNSLIMVGDILERMPTTAFLYLYVPDVDSTYTKAIDLGAQSIEEPVEMPYGDRRAMFADPWGNHWQVATHRAFG